MSTLDSGRSPSTMQELVGHLRDEGFECVVTSFVKNRFLRVADMALALFRHRWKLDLLVVQVFSRRAFFAADVVSFLANRFQIPVIFCVSGGAFPEFLEESPRWTKRVLDRADEIVTPSSDVNNAIGLRGISASVLPHSIVLEDYHFRLRSAPKPRLCWLRSYHEIYNPVNAIEAIAYLKDEFPDIVLAMIGPDGGDGSLERVHAAIQKHNLFQNVEVLSGVPKSEVPNQLSNYDIYLNTTSYESFGIAVMEAAATGMCIVSTDVGELRHLWTNEESAMLVPPKSPKALANAIRRILTEPGLGLRLSANARRTAERHDWKIIFPYWKRLVSHTLRNSPNFQVGIPPTP